MFECCKYEHSISQKLDINRLQRIHKVKNQCNECEKNPSAISQSSIHTKRLRSEKTCKKRKVLYDQSPLDGKLITHTKAYECNGIGSTFTVKQISRKQDYIYRKVSETVKCLEELFFWNHTSASVMNCHEDWLTILERFFLLYYLHFLVSHYYEWNQTNELCFHV